mgnify:CR=1 FL=1
MSFGAYSFDIKESKIKGAGNGLFAACDIPEGSIIGEYAGKRFRNNKILSLEKSSYAANTDTGIVICPDDSCIFRIINDIVDFYTSVTFDKIITHPSLVYNVDWYQDMHDTEDAFEYAKEFGSRRFLNKDYMELEKLYIKTIRDIKAGEELYISYGEDYWLTRFDNDGFRHDFYAKIKN